jgi:hypothetical protein
MGLEIGAAFTVRRDTNMSLGRRLVALVGKGSGPRIAFRARNVVVRIRGLTVGGEVLLDIDGTKHKFDADGEYQILGGEFAQATNNSEGRVICELLL